MEGYGDGMHSFILSSHLLLILLVHYADSSSGYGSGTSPIRSPWTRTR